MSGDKFINCPICLSLNQTSVVLFFQKDHDHQHLLYPYTGKGTFNHLNCILRQELSLEWVVEGLFDNVYVVHIMRSI